MIVSVGDEVWYKGSFGRDMPTKATIISMERTKYEHEKDGTPCENSVWLGGEWYAPFIATLDNGSWGYSYQIEPLSVGVGI